MSKLALVLSCLAVGLSGWVAYTGSTGSRDRLERLEADLDELRVLETRLGNVERRVAASTADRPGPVDAPPLRPTAADGALAGTARDASGPDAATATPPTPVETRIAELAKRLADVEEKAKTLEANPTFATARGGVARALMPRGFVTSMDDAQKQLDLSASQRADWDRILADAKRDLDDLRSLPDDEGKTWKQHNDEMLRGLADGSGRIDLGKLMAMRAKKVPGRTETYGEAEARIRTEAKQRMRDPLTPDQQKRFDESHVDALIGGGLGGGTAVTFATSFGDPPKTPDK